MEIGKTILLDSSGDIVIDDLGRVPTVISTEKAIQDLTVILRSAKGSLETSSTFGMNVQELMESRGNQSIIEGVIRLALEQYAYTKSVDAITIGQLDKTRKLTVSALITLANTNEQISLEVTL